MTDSPQPNLIRETFPVGPLQCNCNKWWWARVMKFKGFY